MHHVRPRRRIPENHVVDAERSDRCPQYLRTRRLRAGRGEAPSQLRSRPRGRDVGTHFIGVIAYGLELIVPCGWKRNPGTACPTVTPVPDFAPSGLFQTTPLRPAPCRAADVRRAAA